MIQGGSRPGLTQEPFSGQLVLLHLFGKEFQRHLSTQGGVLGQVHFSHTSGTDGGHNLVGTDLAPHHGAGLILGQGFGFGLQGRRFQKLFRCLFVLEQRDHFSQQGLIPLALFL